MSNLYCVVCGGDSITGGELCYPFQGLSVASRGDDTQIITQVTTIYMAAGNIVFQNLAVAGTALAGMTTAAQTYADVMPPTRSLGPSSGSGGAVRPTRKYIFSLLAGSNDGCKGGLGSVAAYVSAVVTFCADRKAAGFDAVILGTVLPRDDLGGPLTESDRITYNSTIRAGGWAAANGIDGIFDLGGDATMGDIASCSNATYYDVDKIHPTRPVGQGILAPIWKSTLDAVIATL